MKSYTLMQVVHYIMALGILILCYVPGTSERLCVIFAPLKYICNPSGICSFSIIADVSNNVAMVMMKTHFQT